MAGVSTYDVAARVADAIDAGAGLDVLEEPDDETNRIDGGWSFTVRDESGLLYDVVVVPA